MVTYNTYLEDRQYREVAARAARYYQERAKSNVIPMIPTTIPDAREYRWTVLTDPNASRGIVDWSPTGPKADTQSGYTDYKLNGIQMDLYIPKNNINQYQGETLLADIRQAEIAKWILDVDDAMFKGNYDDSGNVLLDAGGMQAQGTAVIDLNGTDSNLATKGYIWAGINKMIDAIPFAMREEGPDMILFIDEDTYKRSAAPDRIYQDKIEYDFIHEMLVGPKAISGRKIGQIIVTNKVLVAGTDTAGTNGRMILLVPDSRWLGRVVSRGFSLLDEENVMFGIHQAWGWRGSFICDNANALQRSEQIVWA
jgi:hypothetical protein